MAAPFLLLLLLVVSGGAAAGGDGEAGLPRLEFRGIDDTGRRHGPFALEEPEFMRDISTHDDEAGEAPQLEFRGIDDSGRGHASDAPEEPLFMAHLDDEAGEAPQLEFRGIDGSVHGHASDAPEERAFTDVISTGGACDHFARLVAETGNASQLFWERAAGAGGLTVFCPEDKALAEFEPKFRGLGADDRLAVLLYHGAATTYGRKLFQSFDWVSVSSLATDAATNKSHAINVRDDGDTVWLWPSSRSGAGARVTKTVSEEAPLAVYVVDAVLLPNHLRQKLDGGDEPAAACEPSGGYFGWLHCCIPVWQVIAMAVASIAGFLTGFLLHDAVDKMNNKANLSAC
uniref:FAS1 domain-containing protein n=1 Tax=Aegilops tauschii subsp. strangulata TaxID=200361 RepID=A0A453B2I9_AEGTS